MVFTDNAFNNKTTNKIISPNLLNSVTRYFKKKKRKIKYRKQISILMPVIRGLVKKPFSLITRGP